MVKKSGSLFIIGFFIILFSHIITSIISLLFARYLSTHLTFDQLKTATSLLSSQIMRLVNWTIITIGFVFAGYFVSKGTKSGGWIHGSVLGIIWFIFVCLVSFLPFLLPKELIYGPKIPTYIIEQELINVISNMPSILIKTLFLTTTGGLLRQLLSKKFRS